MEQLDEDALWDARERHLAYSERNDEGYKYVEISNLRDKINAKSIAAMIASAAKLVPISANMCQKLDSDRKIAVVQFKNNKDAYQAVSKLKQTPYGKLWRMQIIKDPKLN